MDIRLNPTSKYPTDIVIYMGYAGLPPSYESIEGTVATYKFTIKSGYKGDITPFFDMIVPVLHKHKDNSISIYCKSMSKCKAVQIAYYYKYNYNNYNMSSDFPLGLDFVFSTPEPYTKQINEWVRRK